MGLPIHQSDDEPFDGDLHELIASFRPDAVRVARKLVRTQVEAEDLAQTAVMRVLARAENISDPSFVRPYLMTTVRNLWKNSLRTARRCEPARDETLWDRLADETEVDEPSFSQIDAANLRLAMETLSKANIELIRLRYVERLDYASIGQVLGITAPTARQRVHRARERLREACFVPESDVATRRVCHITRVRLARYARGSLAGRVSARVSLHLRGCEECHHCYTQLIVVLGVDANPDSFPDDPQEEA